MSVSARKGPHPTPKAKPVQRRSRESTRRRKKVRMRSLGRSYLVMNRDVL